MADSSIAITAGTGTTVDTRTEATNGHHRQVVVLGDPSTNAGVAPVDATAGLKVDLGADNDITGTVTANAGTNLNTSALALEAGNLASIKAKTDNIPALGQALAAGSVPVVLPADQITTLTPPAAITGFATSAKQDTIIGHVDGIETSLSSIDGKITAVNTGAVVVSSSALPTGASTLAEQQSQTTHLSTIAGDTTSIQTAVEIIDDTIATLGTTTYTEASTKGAIIGAVRRDADTALVDTTNEVSPLQVDARGLLKVEAFSGETLPVSLTSTTVTGTVAVTQSGTWDEVGINDSGNSITVDYATTGSGTATGALRVELPTNGTGVIATVGAVTAITNALPAGTNAIGKLAANSGVDIGDVTLTASTNNIGDVDVLTIAAGDNNIGNVDVVTLPALPAGTNLAADVGIQPRTTNGLDTFMASGSDGSSILVATSQAVKASAGKVYGYYLYNPEAAVTFVHFYNTASASVTVGTTAPLFTLPIPAGAAANLVSDIGITFGTAIAVAATTTAGGNTAPATGVSATIWFK